MQSIRWIIIKVLEYHIAKKADITVVCKELGAGEDATRFGTVKMNESCRIEEFEEKPMIARSQTISTGIYVIRRRLLIDLVEQCAEEERHDFVNDILIRYKRMQGYNALWQPGTDHASIATEVKVIQALKEQGINKADLTREEFLEKCWDWRKEYGGRIVKQLRKLGSSADWQRERFTMDEGCSHASTGGIYKAL